MRRRIRKKKRVGEFVELGFGVNAVFREGATQESVEGFFERFLSSVMASGLVFAGWYDGIELSGFVMRASRGSASEANRAELTEFLASDELIASHLLGQLTGAGAAA